MKKLNKTEQTEKFIVAANDTNEFKKIKFTQIQIISKVKRYRFVMIKIVIKLTKKC